jgi:hypothetical protein
MSTKRFFITAFAVAALITASFSNIFSGHYSVSNGNENVTFKSAGDSTDGDIINVPPIGH